jgi:hypothetical protein
VSKLIAAYIAASTEKNAEKLRVYLDKHPMAVCFASAEESAVLKQLGLA